MTCEAHVAAILGFPLLPPWDDFIRRLCEAHWSPMQVAEAVALCYLDQSDGSKDAPRNEGPIPQIARKVKSGEPISNMDILRAARERTSGGLELDMNIWKSLLGLIQAKGGVTEHLIYYMLTEYLGGRLNAQNLDKRLKAYRHSYSF